MKKISKKIIWTLLFSLILILTSCETTHVVIIGDVFSNTDDSTLSAIGGSISAIGRASEEITPKSEYEIGRSVAATITRKYGLYKDAPETVRYLNQICKVITMNSPIPYLYNDYCVSILDTDEINAMATPGGHIFISRGLLNCTDSEDAIAAILAHEIAHIQLGHSISVIRSSRISSAAVKTAKAGIFMGAEATMSSLNINKYELKYELYYHGIDVEEFMDSVDEIFESTEKLTQQLVVSGFSKEQEFAADERALFLMENSGYNASAMLDMLKMVEAYENESYSFTDEGWASTHPTPKSRIKKVKKSIKRNKFYVPDMEPRRKRFEEYIKYIKY